MRLVTTITTAAACNPQGALTVDTQLQAVLGLWALALAQEDAFIMGGDMRQHQSRAPVLEAEPLLVLSRLTLALALAHPKDERRLLFVDLTRDTEKGEVLGLPLRGRGCRDRGRTELPTLDCTHWHKKQ